MEKEIIQFDSAATAFYFNADFDNLLALAPSENTFILTDENLMMHYQKELKPWRTIIIPAGEQAKSLETLDDVIRQLIALDAQRDALLIGFGGGVVTDIAGFVAGIYKRGVRCGFMPTSILAMVDAAIGGKNGLDIGEYKNMMGLIRQPEFVLYNYAALATLPNEEWINGFAEIIKHAAILDADMFGLLAQNNIQSWTKDTKDLSALIKRNVLLKAKMVQEDEHEKGRRKLLNFGHTLGHAIEQINELPHGHAVAIGMVFAARIAEKQTGFNESAKLIALLEKYQLPTHANYDATVAFKNMVADKKRTGNAIDFVLLKQIGKAIIQPLQVDQLKLELQ